MEACAESLGATGLPPDLHLPRHSHGHDGLSLADTLYSILPSRALDLSSADLRAASVPAKRYQDSKSSKRKGTPDAESGCPLTPIFSSPGYWTPSAKAPKRSRMAKASKMELHQSTLLNLNQSGAESDLWILPDFEEWEADDNENTQAPSRTEVELGPLLQRAVNSNRERLRRRLEGDGWDFVGGKYGEDGQMLREVERRTTSESEESVDEEFDVVVLEVIEPCA